MCVKGQLKKTQNINQIAVICEMKLKLGRNNMSIVRDI